MGPKRWVHRIRKYIEHKLNYKLFDRTIAAWKVRGEIYKSVEQNMVKPFLI